MCFGFMKDHINIRLSDGFLFGSYQCHEILLDISSSLHQIATRQKHHPRHHRYHNHRCQCSFLDTIAGVLTQFSSLNDHGIGQEILSGLLGGGRYFSMYQWLPCVYFFSIDTCLFGCELENSGEPTQISTFSKHEAKVIYFPYILK